MNALVKHHGGNLFATRLGEPRDHLVCAHVRVAVPRLPDVYFGPGAFLSTGLGETLHELQPFRDVPRRGRVPR